MNALNVKLRRDLWSMKGQMAAVALVMACGLMVMIMARGLVMSWKPRGTNTTLRTGCRMSSATSNAPRTPSSRALG